MTRKEFYTALAKGSLPHGTEFWMGTVLDQGSLGPFRWLGDAVDRGWVSDGVIRQTKEEAEALSDKLVAISKSDLAEILRELGVSE